MRTVLPGVLAALFLVLAVGVGLSARPAHAAEEATWVRYPAIAPDGATVVFAYRGDLWSVPAQGGEARRLTTHEAYETRPVWSHDGQRIAFASNRHGNFDVFVMPAAGGPATRLTFHAAHDYPSDFELDSDRVLFTSARHDAPEAILPSSYVPELWSIAATGGRPRLELTTPAEWVRVSSDGKQAAYEDRRGYENTWRKHHVSPVTRDIWLWDRETGAQRRLTSFGGEDRNPVWAPDGERLYYLSEKEGSYNVYLLDAGVRQRVTSHEDHPVRFLSVASNGVLCYGWNGAVYTRREGEEPRRLPILVASDARRNVVERSVTRKDATEMSVSPDGEEVAFVVRGEVFVASVEHGTTKRITTTPEQERSVAWAPDGKTLYYAGERHRDGSDLPSWNLYRTTLAREDDERFHRATLLTEDALLADEHETFQPVPSPDGKHLAFVRDRDEICVLDLATRNARTMVPADRNYSYADGDLAFSWSPDSRWLAVTYLANRAWIEQIGIVDVASAKARNVTLSGYYESNPKWTPDGRALAFTSNRHGRRAHGSWGSEQDVLAIYLTQEGFDRATLPEEEFDRLRDREKKAKKKGRRRGGGDDDVDDDSDDDDDETKAEPVPEVRIDFENLERRLRRVSMYSAPISDFVVSKDGEACLYGAEMDGKWDVWMVKPRPKETRRVLRLGDDRGPELALSKDGKTLFVRRRGGRIVKADVGGILETERKRGRRGRDGEDDEGGGRWGGGREAQSEPVAFRAELDVDVDAERRHLFEHIWRQARDKFYVADLHGADWTALRRNYGAHLSEIENGYEFAELCSELLGELNASHTGCSYRPPRVEDGDDTAALGLLFANAGRPDGLEIAEVLVGGPCRTADSKIRAGHVLTAIDGETLGLDSNPWRLLNRKAGKRTRLALLGEDGETYEQVVRPIERGAESQLLYRRLLERRRALVEKASGGRVGYVHVRGMNDRSFRHTFRETLGRNADKEALVVDTRFNGGGWLHDDLVVFLSGKRYMDFVPRGKERGGLGGEPLHRWSKPSCVLMSEGNYSDAHLFPVAYRIHGIGKLVGAPVAGTGTAVWWERLIQPGLRFGIPQVGMVDAEGDYQENKTLEPDVLVLTDPVKIANGVDEQLLAAVETLLEELSK